MESGNRGASWIFWPSCFISGRGLGYFILKNFKRFSFNAYYEIIALTDPVGDRLTSMLEKKAKSWPGEFAT